MCTAGSTCLPIQPFPPRLQRLKAAGLAGIRLTSTWQQADAGESDLGVFSKEPRQA